VATASGIASESARRLFGFTRAVAPADLLQDKDTDAAMKLTDDTCVVTGASGAASIDRKAFAGMLNSPGWTLNEFEFVGEVIARAITDDVGVVAYKVREQLTVDGKPLTLEAADASTWIRRDGRWLCVLHTESIIGDPFAFRSALSVWTSRNFRP